ncbi:hypothetical protein [Amycolatopsis sp. w19]|uniref:hypothetical protein n=1 Tax=Amycolatopsis sp. w19 TaxID=3448134 RepID=UPI003F1B90D3
MVSALNPFVRIGDERVSFTAVDFRLTCLVAAVDFRLTCLVAAVDFRLTCLVAAVDFRLTCLVAAAVFGVLTVVQIRALPAHENERDHSSVWSDWRAVVANRSFLLFALVMIGSYVLSFQTYLALPMEARRITGSETSATVLIAGLFVISGGLAIAGQLKITAWAKARWPPGTCLAVGMTFMAAAFVAPLTVARAGPVVAGAGLLVSAALLAVGTVVVFPFEMDTVVRLSGDRLVATHTASTTRSSAWASSSGNCSPAPSSTSHAGRVSRSSRGSP